MTQSRSTQQIVAGIMGDSTSFSKGGRIAFSRFEAILLCTCACTLFEHKIFLLALRINRLIQLGTVLWLPSVILLDLMVLGIIYLFLTVPLRWHLTTRGTSIFSKAIATAIGLFVIIATSASMVLLIETGFLFVVPSLILGHELKWKLAFEVDFSSTKSLFTPQIPVFSAILVMQPILGILCSLLIRFWLSKGNPDTSSDYLPIFNTSSRSTRKSPKGRVKSILYWFFRWKFVFLITIYILLVATLRPSRPWNSLSNNPVGGLFWTLFHHPRHHHNRPNTPPPTWTQKFIDYVAQQISAPPVDLVKPPRAFLKHPIRNVVIINLESVRADALPFSHDLVRSVGTKLVNENLTAEDLTPFWTSLMPDSLIMSDTSATSSYTLKTLLSTFCGMYPLNVNFMEEGRDDRHFYQECLPELIRRQFPSTTTHKRWWQRSPTSRFRSAFFQSSENTFDHQAEEFEKMGWDDRFYAPDVERFTPGAQKMGWFGVGDNDLLPLVFDWIDRTLGEKKQVLAGILTTSTHFPFPLPDGEGYIRYVTDDIVNKYLNSIRKTDEFLRSIITGFEARGVLNETMFVMLGDHGHAFDDWDHRILGALDNPMENGFRVPFMVYSPALVAGGSVDGKYTNLDVLPTVMDALISSSQDPSWQEEYSPEMPLPVNSVPESTTDDFYNSTSVVNETDIREMSEEDFFKRRQSGNLLDLNGEHWVRVEHIVNRYEGTSVFRHPRDPNHPQRMTFHLDNPGNAHVILVQYPMKLVYDAIGEQTYLYDLSHDYREWDDLLSIPYSRGKTTPPEWVDWSEEDLAREFRLNWWISGVDEFGEGRTAPDRDSSIEYVKPDNETGTKDGTDGKLNLEKAFNWAEDAFEILLGWSWINRERYLTGRMEVDIVRSTALESLRDDGRRGG